MAAWIRPVEYDVAADRGIIMNKESSYEFGLEDGTGALQGAFSPCWRWFGTTRVPAHEWTHVGVRLSTRARCASTRALDADATCVRSQRRRTMAHPSGTT